MFGYFWCVNKEGIKYRNIGMYVKGIIYIFFFFEIFGNKKYLWNERIIKLILLILKENFYIFMSIYM